YIILIAMMIISLTVITGKALLTHMAKKGNAAYRERKEYQKLVREQQLAYEAEHPQEIPVRRPPTTFVFSSGKKQKSVKDAELKEAPVININDVRSNKDDKHNVDELSNLNLDHLFADQESKAMDEASTKMAADIDHGPVPTYEDELRSKFGKGTDKEEEERLV